MTVFRLCRFCLIVAVGIFAATQVSAQEEVPVGSKLRSELFDLARVKIEKKAGRAVLFEGSMKKQGDWVFFSGRVVDGKGQTIRVGPGESGETAFLLRRKDGKWKVVVAEVGFGDVIYAGWPQEHGVPGALVGF